MARFRRTLLKQVQDTVNAYRMLEGAQTVLVAFSGGPDSVCLLDSLYRSYRKKIHLHLVYINHGLRPVRVLQREERMAQEIARDYDIPCTVMRVKVNKGKIGTEAAARKARYAALHKCMKEMGADRIALGHNLDDVIETFFLNLVRGSGTRGLLGIPPVRLPFIRPLIDVRKHAIHAYLKRRKLRFAVDATNILPRFRRNVLRHRIIPQFLKINPELHAAIQREIALLRQDHEYLEHQARAAYSQVVRRDENHVLLDIKKLMQYNPALVNRMLMRAIASLRGDLEGFESKHYAAILGLIGKETGKRVNLVKGIWAQRSYEHLLIGKARPSKRGTVFLDAENDTVMYSDMRVMIRTVSTFNLGAKGPDCEVFDRDQLTPPLTIRSTVPGDHIEMKTGRQRMKKLFSEFKVLPHRRRGLGLLCDQQGILWVLGLKRAYRALVGEGSKNILVVEIENINRKKQD